MLLTCHGTVWLSAQAGHMAALHKIGQMYSQGIATGKSCSTAVHAFKGTGLPPYLHATSPRLTA